MKIKVKVVFMPTVDVFSIRCFQSKTMHCNGRSQNAVAKLIADILYIIYHTLYIIQHTDQQMSAPYIYLTKNALFIFPD